MKGTVSIKQHEETGLFVVGLERNGTFQPFCHSDGTLLFHGVPLTYKLYANAKAAFDFINASIKKASDVQTERSQGNDDTRTDR